VRHHWVTKRAASAVKIVQERRTEICLVAAVAAHVGL